MFDFIRVTLRNFKKKKLLNDRIEIRINCTEKILFEKYAKVCGIEVEDLIKGLMRKEIDKFIKG